MSYRTVLVHVDESARTSERIGVAADIARRCEAHLVAVAFSGVSRFLYQSELSEADDPTLALHRSFLRERAQQALEACARQVDDAALASFEARLVDDEAGAGVSLHARGADLVVLGQIEPDHPPPALMSDFPAYVVVNSGRPVLIVPYAGQFAALGRDVLVSWNASREAARALLLALPLLRQAARVRLALFDAPPASRAQADAYAPDPLAYLARHGVRAELSVHAIDARRTPQRQRDLGEALLSLATDVSADLLVMGAYGHSRFRETLLGGVTRTVLGAMTIPVLMAH